MKKLILIAFALITGAILAHAQGTITIQSGKGTVITNASDIGLGTGNAYAGLGSYYYELLDMPATTWGALTAQQQSAAYSLLDNFDSGVSLWTDSGISGVNAGGLTTGGITGMGGVTGTTAANWAAPTSNSGYNTATNFDYYTVVGWSANLGTSWGAISNSIASGDIFGGPFLSFFGQTSEAYNYAGGGASDLNAPNVFGSSTQTGLAGSGLPSNSGALVLNVIDIPEPATLALASLGGLSMLLLRRRKT